MGQRRVFTKEFKEEAVKLARQEGASAYIVFSDAMCRKKPVSTLQFSGVNGVGQVKLEKYGELFTGVIRDHVNA